MLLQVMKEVNNLMRVPELSATMQQMSKEMMKAGMIDEMMGDAIDGALDSEDMEEETDQEVEKVSGQGTCICDAQAGGGHGRLAGVGSTWHM